MEVKESHILEERDQSSLIELKSLEKLDIIYRDVKNRRKKLANFRLITKFSTNKISCKYRLNLPLISGDHNG